MYVAGLVQVELHVRVQAHWPTAHAARLQIGHDAVVGHRLGVWNPAVVESIIPKVFVFLFLPALFL